MTTIKFNPNKGRFYQSIDTIDGSQQINAYVWSTPELYFQLSVEHRKAKNPLVGVIIGQQTTVDHYNLCQECDEGGMFFVPMTGEAFQQVISEALDSIPNIDFVND